MSERSDELRLYLDRIAKYEAAIQKTIASNQESIRTLSWINQKLYGSAAGLGFFRRTYSTADPSSVDAMPDNHYKAWVLPLRSVALGGDAFIGFAEDAAGLADKAGSMAGTLSTTSAVITASTGDSAVTAFALGPTVGVSRSLIEEEIAVLLKTLQVGQDIEYLKKQLLLFNAAIAHEFEHFISAYYAHTDNTAKYVELIGFRTLLFFRTIGGTADMAGISLPTYTRADQIRYFILGNNGVSDQNSTAVVDLLRALWKELSDQDPSGESVKTGKVSANYIELLFRKAVTVFSATMRQRAINFR